MPGTYRIMYLDGENFIPVQNASSLVPENNKYNTVTFDEVSTSSLRLEVDSAVRIMDNVLEWKVYQAENSPDHPPVVSAGGDRDVMLGGETYLSGHVKTVGTLDRTVWSKDTGPGKVDFGDPRSIETTAVFSETGEYVLTLTAADGRQKASSSLKVLVHEPPRDDRLDVVYT